MIKWLEKHKLAAIILTLLIAIEIFCISSLSFKKDIEKFSLESYLYHFIIFFLLCFFLCMSLNKKGKNPTKIIIPTLILTILYAISDEVHQLFIPSRSFAISDILTDTTGILSAILCYYKYKLKNKLN